MDVDNVFKNGKERQILRLPERPDSKAKHKGVWIAKADAVNSIEVTLEGGDYLLDKGSLESWFKRTGSANKQFDLNKLDSKIITLITLRRIEQIKQKIVQEGIAKAPEVKPDAESKAGPVVTGAESAPKAKESDAEPEANEAKAKESDAEPEANEAKAKESDAEPEANEAKAKEADAESEAGALTTTPANSYSTKAKVAAATLITSVALGALAVYLNPSLVFEQEPAPISSLLEIRSLDDAQRYWYGN